MATYPADGTPDWGPPLQDYIDDSIDENELNKVVRVPTQDGSIGVFTIVGDGSDSEDWPDRVLFQYTEVEGGPGVGSSPFFLNECFEARFMPAKNSTIPVRIFRKRYDASPNHNVNVPLFQIMNDRDNRVELMSIGNDGAVKAPNVQNKVVCVPTGTSGWESHPDGTLWVEYTP